jgi:hypothetical protein
LLSSVYGRIAKSKIIFGRLLRPIENYEIFSAQAKFKIKQILTICSSVIHTLELRN